MSVVWSAISSRQYEFKAWDNEGVLFLKDSGDTHLLNEAGIQILKLLNSKALALDELVDQLNRSFGHSNKTQFTKNIVQGLLTELYYLGVLSKANS